MQFVWTIAICAIQVSGLLCDCPKSWTKKDILSLFWAFWRKKNSIPSHRVHHRTRPYHRHWSKQLAPMVRQTAKNASVFMICHECHSALHTWHYTTTMTCNCNNYNVVYNPINNDICSYNIGVKLNEKKYRFCSWNGVTRIINVSNILKFDIVLAMNDFYPIDDTTNIPQVVSKLLNMKAFLWIVFSAT